MSTTKHTPGPWRIESHKRLVAENGYCVAILYTGDNGPDSDLVCKANARLIAAAPELLTVVERVRALEKSVEDKGLLDISPVDLGELFSAARAAIAKAGGAQ